MAAASTACASSIHARSAAPSPNIPTVRSTSASACRCGTDSAAGSGPGRRGGERRARALDPPVVAVDAEGDGEEVRGARLGQPIELLLDGAFVAQDGDVARAGRTLEIEHPTIGWQRAVD